MHRCNGIRELVVHRFTRGKIWRAQSGLYHGKGEGRGNNVSYSMRKTKRTWKPNVHWKTFYSELLDQKFQVRVSTKALRCIDKAGGVDNYILFTPEKTLDSAIGLELKKHLKKAWEKKHGVKFQRSKVLHEEKVRIWTAENSLCEQYRQKWIKENTVKKDPGEL